MRHMMKKKILDATDLQPQYRTFSEIRDYMLQLARQKAYVYVGDVCLSTKKPGTVTPRVSSNTNASHRHKGLSSGPNGFVSDELERLEIRNSGTGERLVSV